MKWWRGGEKRRAVERGRGREERGGGRQGVRGGGGGGGEGGERGGGEERRRKRGRQKGGVKRDLRRSGVQFKFKSPPDGGTRRGDAVELPLTVKDKWKNVFEEEPTGARSAFAPHRPKRSSKTSSW
jgi:hypothetical protein